MNKLIVIFTLSFCSVVLICDSSWSQTSFKQDEFYELTPEEKKLERISARRKSRKGEYVEPDMSNKIPGKVYVRGHAAPLPEAIYKVDSPTAITVINTDELAKDLKAREEAKDKIRRAREAKKN